MALIDRDIQRAKFNKIKRQLEVGNVKFRDVVVAMYRLEAPLSEIRNTILDCASAKFFVLVNPPKAETSETIKKKVLHKLYMGDMSLERAIWYLRAEGVDRKELFHLLGDMIDEIYDHVSGRR